MHEPVGSVKELKVGLKLREVTKLNKMSLGVEKYWKGCS